MVTTVTTVLCVLFSSLKANYLVLTLCYLTWSCLIVSSSRLANTLHVLLSFLLLNSAGEGSALAPAPGNVLF